MTPTQLSKRHLQKEGYLVDVTEHWNAFARQRKDLFGFIDLLAIKDGVLAVQTTSRANMSSRIKKILEHENYPLLKQAGIAVVVHGWKKNSRNRWELKYTLL